MPVGEMVKIVRGFTFMSQRHKAQIILVVKSIRSQGLDNSCYLNGFRPLNNAEESG